MKKLLEFQKQGIAQILKKRNTLLADEMGLGKTIQAIGAINRWQGMNKILIICPASVKLNWLRELNIWLTKYYDIKMIFGKKNLTIVELNNSEIIIMNYDLVDSYKHLLQKINWDLKIVDECQYLTGMDSQRTNAVLKIWSRKNIFLSGTPAEKPIEFWPILNHLCPEKFSHFWTFAKRYCDPRMMKNAHIDIDEWNLNGAENLSELRKKLYASIMIRRKKEDVLNELQSKKRTMHYLPDTCFEKYSKYERKLLGGTYNAIIKRIQNKGIAINENLATIRKEVGIKKVPRIINMLEMYARQHFKVLCYVYHTDVLNMLKAHFKDRCVTINGTTRLEERELRKERFKNDSTCSIYIGQIIAMCIGTDGLQDITNVGVFGELDWSFKRILQAEDRIHRFGQKDQAEYHYLILKNSLEDHILRVLEGKKRNYNEMLDRPLRKEEM